MKGQFQSSKAPLHQSSFVTVQQSGGQNQSGVFLLAGALHGEGLSLFVTAADLANVTTLCVAVLCENTICVTLFPSNPCLTVLNEDKNTTTKTPRHHKTRQQRHHTTTRSPPQKYSHGVPAHRSL